MTATRRPPWWGLALAGVALVALWARSTGAEPDELAVSFVSPEVGVPLFGDVELEVEVRGRPPEEIATVQFFVDGLFVGEATVPPFRIRHDFGESNATHRLEALASTRDREEALSRDRGQVQLQGHGRGRALLVSPAIRVDLEVDAPLQQLYVSVRDGDDRSLLDLERDDFTVLDGGRRQTIVTFERGGVPLAAVLLLDASDSMAGQRLRAATAGARAFLERMSTLDEAKLMLFADRLLHASPFTNVADVLVAGLGTVEARGATALNDHLFVGLRELDRRQGRRVLVLLSDGVDVASILDMEQVLAATARSPALIYWLRLGGAKASNESFYSAWRGAENHARELELLETAVERSGGQIIDLASAREAAAAFNAVVDDLRNQFVLGYYPTRNVGDGAWHPVEVRVKRRGVEVRTRAGYVDS